MSRTARKIAMAATFLALIVGAEAISPVSLTGLVGQANAIIGRPLTPISVAGVARRTVRRCAVGVYHC